MRTNFLGLPVDALTMEETVSAVETIIKNKVVKQHMCINAAKVVNSFKNSELKDSILDSDLISADGQSVVWASKLLGSPLPERVAGIDLMAETIEMAKQKGYTVFLLGAKPEVVLKVSQTIPEENLAGFHHGYFAGEEDRIANLILESKADILFVAMSSPHKEVFCTKYKDVMNVPFVMGVGGSFDVIAGVVRRAPKVWQNMGAEWLYRLLQEPRRMFGRYLKTNTLFAYYLLKNILGIQK
jgi:N-acetylglucosaminyldiphosphoundecaprenol N-acetyl-beta-D-mannosaminyltransferase